MRVKLLLEKLIMKSYKQKACKCYQKPVTN